MYILFEDCEKSVTPDDFKDIESLFNRQFPDDFKEHYYVYNGGNIAMHDNFGCLMVTSLIPLKYGSNTIMDAYAVRLNDDPPSPLHSPLLVPFAWDFIGNLYYISLNQSSCGEVYVYSMDHEEYFFAANSFTDLMNKVKKQLFNRNYNIAR